MIRSEKLLSKPCLRELLYMTLFKCTFAIKKFKQKKKAVNEVILHIKLKENKLSIYLHVFAKSLL